MNIAVYLGSSAGNNPVYREAVEKLGQWIGKSGHTLIYGGSRSGLMGCIAQAALAQNGTVIGVEPQFFIEKEFQLDGLTELIVTQNMQQRREKMIALSDAFIAFPGGTGTIEEISEVISGGSLDLIHGVYGFYNVNGYYDFMKQGLDFMVQEGFLSQANRDKIQFWDSLEEIINSLSSR